MFGTPANVHISVPNTEWQPGQTIQGKVTVNAKSSLDVSAIEVSLQGTVTTVVYRRSQPAGHCDTSNGNRAGTSEVIGDSDAEQCVTDQVQFLSHGETMFPPKCLGKQKSRTLKKGEHTYDFELRIPDTCEGQDSQWLSLPLPPSCSLPRKRGGITYRLQASVKRPGLFSKTITANQPVRISRYGEAVTNTRQAFARRGLSVFVYPHKGKTGMMFKIKLGLGFAAPRWKQHFAAELRVPVAGIPVSSVSRGREGTLVLDQIELFVTRDEDASPKDTPTTFYLTALKLTLVGNYTVQARGAVEVVQQREKLMDVKPQLPLQFVDGKADITNLVTNAAVITDFVPTLLLPVLQVSYELHAELSIAPDPLDAVPKHVIISTPLVLRYPLPPVAADGSEKAEKTEKTSAGASASAGDAATSSGATPSAPSSTGQSTDPSSHADPSSHEDPPPYESHAPHAPLFPSEKS